MNFSEDQIWQYCYCDFSIFSHGHYMIITFIADMEKLLSMKIRESICIWKADYSNVRRSHPDMFCKKGILKNFAKFTGKHMPESFFNKTTAVSLLLKNRIWRRCFPVNFANFSRPLFSQNTSGGCF